MSHYLEIKYCKIDCIVKKREKLKKKRLKKSKETINIAI